MQCGAAAAASLDGRALGTQQAAGVWFRAVHRQSVFLKSVSSFTPFRADADLQAFLAAGEPPVYVGFGSLVVKDPAGLTACMVQAAQAAGKRLLLHKGWGGLGQGLSDPPPDGVMLLDAPVPHDWLFTQCSAVVHHGGAGTTAAGLKAGESGGPLALSS